MTRPAIVYSPNYDFRTLGIERLIGASHPFDIHKFKKAMASLRRTFGRRLDEHLVAPRRAATRELLALVHTPEYLDSLKDPMTIAMALEVPQLGRVPALLLDAAVLRPMRWATAGTILAFEQALACGGAINLGGGYHHASMSRGEGFCVYADAAIAIRRLTQSGALTATSKILCVDLDAHMGNGFARCVADDPRVAILDVYNGMIYPGDPEAREIIDADVPLYTPMSRSAERYRAVLEERLPAFLDRYWPRKRGGDGEGLLIYNAGTDVYEHDQLGGFGLGAEDVTLRDHLVITEARRRGLPWVMLPSGGYSSASFGLIAGTCAWAVRSARERE